jgi:cyclopropane-fatty-acyl-phospholipid synthase
MPMTDPEARAGRLAFPVPTFSSTIAPLASTGLDRWALERIKRSVASAPIRFMLWDGFEVGPDGGLPVATIIFKNRRALFGLAYDSDLNFGEAYMFGAMEVSGDLPALLEAIYRARPRGAIRPGRLRRRPNDLRAARANVHNHYDLGSDFYRLWLDRELVYTCAYFPEPDVALHAAQIAKMHLVCRKLQLRPGERVIEAGCGWGALALFMAKHYGVSVRAFNVSSEQIAYARDRASREDLDRRVEFVEDDYRNIAGVCDAFVSVGMLEHVGLPDFPALGRIVDRSLGPDGRGLLHFIGRNRPAPLNPWICRRIFPGAYPPTPLEVFAHVLELHDFSLLDVENLRLHYAKTIEHWLRRFEESAREVEQMFDEPFVRAWRLYLAGSHAAFTSGSMQLFQMVFARGATNRIPWIRATS